MIRYSILFLLFSSNCALAQKEKCVMPQGWYGITPFGWSEKDFGYTASKFQTDLTQLMYLYQLCHLLFPENVALNKSHFQEKKIGLLAEWSRQKFPDIQTRKD